MLFCDLVGFTASAHAADPEDVCWRLTAYHVAVRAEIERFGGVVEKFIGRRRGWSLGSAARA